MFVLYAWHIMFCIPCQVQGIIRSSLYIFHISIEKGGHLYIKLEIGLVRQKQIMRQTFKKYIISELQGQFFRVQTTVNIQNIFRVTRKSKFKMFKQHSSSLSKQQHDVTFEGFEPKPPTLKSDSDHPSHSSHVYLNANASVHYLLILRKILQLGNGWIQVSLNCVLTEASGFHQMGYEWSF